MKRSVLAGVIVAVGIAAFLHPPSSSRAVVQVQTPALTGTARVHRSLPLQIVVYVAGAVVRPGLYRLAPGSRGVDAVRAAGGLKPNADPAGVNLAEQLDDGEQITAPLVGERVVRHHTAKTHHRKHGRHKRAEIGAPTAQIDLNTADAQTLAQLPGIGDELARRLVAFRDANGAFTSLDELADVAGMTQRRIDDITPYLVIQR